MSNGPKVVLRPEAQELVLPGDMEFPCPACKALCKTNAKTRQVKHALPTCARWEEAIKTKEGPGQFLIEAGVVQLLPAAARSN